MSEKPECPECESVGSVSSNPILDDEFECSTCRIAFNADGEVTARAE